MHHLQCMIQHKWLKEKLFPKMPKHALVIKSPNNPVEAAWLSWEAMCENQVTALMAVDCCAEMFDSKSRGIFIILDYKDEPQRGGFLSWTKLRMSLKVAEVSQRSMALVRSGAVRVIVILSCSAPQTFTTENYWVKLTTVVVV